MKSFTQSVLGFAMFVIGVLLAIIGFTVAYRGAGGDLTKLNS